MDELELKIPYYHTLYGHIVGFYLTIQQSDLLIVRSNFVGICFLPGPRHVFSIILLKVNFLVIEFKNSFERHGRRIHG